MNSVKSLLRRQKEDNKDKKVKLMRHLGLGDCFPSRAIIQNTIKKGPAHPHGYFSDILARVGGFDNMQRETIEICQVTQSN